MKAPLKYIGLAVLAAVIASPARADDTPRFSADDFLKEWTVFLNEEEENSAKDTGRVNLNAPETEKKGKEAGFIYFNTEGLSVAATTPLSLQNQNEATAQFTPRKTSLSTNLENIVLPSESWLLNSFTPRYVGTALSFSTASDGSDGENDSKFDFSLSSQVTSRQTNIFGAVNNDYVLEALNRQVYDVGVTVGYSGFSLAASLRGEDGAYFKGIAGYDIGFSYNRPTWSTSLLVGEYRQGNNLLLGLSNGLYDDRFFAVEFGAAYKMAPWFQFVGSFRYYEDANLILLDPTAISTTRMFYLGTKLNF